MKGFNDCLQHAVECEGAMQMKRIIQSDYFDIDVTASKDYKGQYVYLVRYGLQVSEYDSLGIAMQGFNDCLQHAVECEGE